MRTNFGFEQLTSGAAVVRQEQLPGVSYDAISVNDGTKGFVTVTMFATDKSAVGVTQYLTKEEARKLALHMLTLAEAL